MTSTLVNQHFTTMVVDVVKQHLMTIFRTLILFLALGLLSCGSKKEVVKKTSPDKVVIDSLIITKVPDATPPPSPPDPPVTEEGEIFEMIEVVDEKGNTIAEVESLDEAKELMKEKQNDSINDLSHHQNVSKRFYENHELWEQLLKKHVTESGSVNYKEFQKDGKDLSAYINMLKMGYSKINEYSQEKKLAFWINTYNALTVDLILRHYPIKSIKDIKDPWDQRLWKFGDKWLNLNEIEHKILRKMNEPRIHFAIVCASESCPKLQNEAFTASNLETMLTMSTKDFLSDSSKNEISANSIRLSKIFKWFTKDFKQNGSLIDFLNLYSDVQISNGASKSFKDYNWDLNE